MDTNGRKLNWKWWKNNDPERKKRRMERKIRLKRVQMLQANKPGRLQHLNIQIHRLEAYVQWM